MDNEVTEFWSDLFKEDNKPARKRIEPIFYMDDYYAIMESLDEISEEMQKTMNQTHIRLQRIKNELMMKVPIENNELNDSPNVMPIHSKMLNDDVLLIHMDHLLPMINDENLRQKRYFNELRNYYVNTMAHSIKPLNTNFANEKVFVAIVQYYPTQVIRDIDNHFIKFIFNSLRYSGVIEDDNFTNIYYMMLGTLDTKKSSDTGYTEIYVTDKTNMNNVLNILPI